MNPIIRQIVGRCHVDDSYSAVIRYVISRMAHGYKSFNTLPRWKRKAMLRQIVRVHRENREFYDYVVYRH